MLSAVDVVAPHVRVRGGAESELGPPKLAVGMVHFMVGKFLGILLKKELEVASGVASWTLFPLKEHLGLKVLLRVVKESHEIFA